MSSLTTLGINKNKKGFAPKINAKRNVRKAPSASTEKSKETTIDESTEKIPESIATESSRNSNITTVETIKTSNSSTTSVSTVTKEKEKAREITVERTNTASEKSSKNTTTIIAASKSKVTKKAITKTKPKAKPISIVSNAQDKSADTPTQANEGSNISGLTEEEIAMNAIAARRRRNKKLMMAPSPLTASSPPISAPSPMAPVIDRSDCALEVSDAPVLKIERMSPGPDSGRKSMSRPVKADEEEEDDAKMLATAPAASEPASPMRFDTSTPVDSDIDVEMDYDMPSPLVDTSPPPESRTPSPSPSPPSPSLPPPTTQPTRVSGRKNKGKGKVVDDEFFEPRKSSSTTKPPKKRAKTRTTAASSSGSTGINVPSSTSKATPISIGIGVPSAIPSEYDDEEEDYDGNEYLRPARKGKTAGLKRKFGDKFAFRLPENLKTLDDISHDPAKVENLEKSMSTFTKDINGIVSKHFKELELARFAAIEKLEAAANMTPEELAAQKEKEKEEEELAERKKQIAKEKEEERRKREADSSVLAESSNALQVRLINGQIVLDTDSLTIERTEADRDYGDGAMEIVEESSMTRKVNSQTYGKRQSSSRWTALETEQFYEYLSQFGTDFEMISMVMPRRTRQQVRAKFNREERCSPEKITEHLIRKKKPLDIAKYQELAGIELEAVPEDFHEMQLA